MGALNDGHLDLLLALVVGIFGGGAIWRLLWGAAAAKLRKDLAQEFAARGDYATRHDVDGLGARVNGLETVAVQARDAADEAQQGVRDLRKDQDHAAARTAEQIGETTRRLEDCLSRVEKAMNTIIRLEERLAAASRGGPHPKQGE